MPSLFLALALLSALAALLWRIWYTRDGPRTGLRALPILAVLVVLWGLIFTIILNQIH